MRQVEEGEEGQGSGYSSSGGASRKMRWGGGGQDKFTGAKWRAGSFLSC